MPISAQFRRPFAEQTEFFRRKLNLPTTRSGQITRDQNDAAFVVAGATKADLLADLRGAVDDAISNGQSWASSASSLKRSLPGVVGLAGQAKALRRAAPGVPALSIKPIWIHPTPLAGGSR